ncbi:MAG: hypothetical protein WCY15_13220 [Phenylobacterium sp.]|uniref:hypothetical protein n=1 Tax=Phenylobacterium sp. TaxID=1871053 RepID=UPI003569B23A
MSAPYVVAELRKNARETVRVALDTYQGRNLLDLRVCLPLAEHAPSLQPTRKGIALAVALLPRLREALEDAEAEARSRGWLE